MPDFAVAFAWGALGGLIAELFKWFQLRDSPNLRSYIGRPIIYWAITLAMIVVGGVLAAAYDTSSNPVLAINIGVSAPLIVKMLAGSTPVTAPPPIAPPQPGASGSHPTSRGQSTMRPRAALAVAAEPSPTPLAFLAGR